MRILVLKQLINNIYNLPNLFYNEVIFLLLGVKKSSYKINGRLYIRNSGTIVIGKNFKGNSGVRYNPIGGDTILRLIAGSKGLISIGNDVGISNSTIYSKIGVTIESGVLIGGGCKIWDTDFHSIQAHLRGTKEDEVNTMSKPILIKRKAFIGADSKILKGVVIGENSIIAAGSVVSKSIPANEIWGGNPANFLKKLE